MSELLEKAKKAKAITRELAVKTTEQKNEALRKISEQLIKQMDYILTENEKDIEAGKKNGLSESLLDRLRLTKSRIQDMADALLQLVDLKDPVGEVLAEWDRPNGLKIKQVRVPLGVVGMIYEARPNVTVDASSLCLKTGNAVILRGSSSAINSNKAIVQVIHEALAQTDIPSSAVQLLEDTSRETASQMFKLNEYLDVLIPRGGAGLIKSVVENSTIPVLETGVGNCHVYIDETADKEMAIKISVNAKTQRPSVCNACETILVHSEWANKHLSELVEALQEKGVEIRGDQKVREIAPDVLEASEDDWGTEFLDLIVAMKVVDDVTEAIEHINTYGSLHSEAIISETPENVEKFFNYVDAAALYHNASTRFTDGFEFGFGAEIGISTQKLHARGPMGLPALTSTKYIVKGTGQIRN
ncbi:glutamate-5-semialdehyde dehydrogenase [Calidifontibacillus erzurumensis]|uniref:Gamma-glutamyl phosphate reductase n=1 Tax=Calidifontibacillus erzurumensis TaxID=2741433 RepID=A0A8J8GC29_9BACI|nr:glutamate-5-semialdehyde dehydrogenase [Calidifontibacillus erzurumensis]NSL50667.1 glutamate-5-semialdehyde dehydrogenase [Calidifontibacillus erzurumensis]